MNYDRKLYYRDGYGRTIYYSEIARLIRELHPSLIGEHIFSQLVALGLYEGFQKGTTPCGLPYSFTDEE